MTGEKTGQAENDGAFVAGWSALSSARLKAAIKAFGSQGHVAEKAGISRQSLVEILRFEDQSDVGSRPRYGTLKAVCDVIGADPRAIVASPADIVASKVVHALGDLNGQFDVAAKTLSKVVDGATVDGLIRIPFHDISVSAGQGLLAMDRLEADGYWPMPVARLAEMSAAPEQLHLLPVKGDSMAPTLNDGDWVMIDRSRRDWVDGLYVARFHDDLFVKRVQFEGRMIRLVSDNASYRTIEIPRDDEADVAAFDLLGRVIWKAGSI